MSFAVSLVKKYWGQLVGILGLTIALSFEVKLCGNNRGCARPVLRDSLLHALLHVAAAAQTTGDNGLAEEGDRTYQDWRSKHDVRRAAGGVICLERGRQLSG